MKALILAAGLGTRLRPITDEVPKCMVPVNGVTIIKKQLSNLIDNGVEDIYIITGYKGDILKKHIEELGYSQYVTFIDNEVYETTNNMYSLNLAKNYVENEPFLLMNADVFYEEGVIRDLLNDKEQNLIACEANRYIEESMKIICEERITTISKQVTEEEAYGTTIDVYKFSAVASKKLFDIIHDIIYVQEDNNSWSEVAINKLFEVERFYPLDITYNWVEIDNHDDLALAEKLF